MIKMGNKIVKDIQDILDMVLKIQTEELDIEDVIAEIRFIESKYINRKETLDLIVDVIEDWKITNEDTKILVRIEELVSDIN